MAPDEQKVKTQGATVEFQFGPSSGLRRITVFAHACALIAIWLSSLIAVVQILLSCVVFYSGARYCRRSGFSASMRYTGSTGWERFYSNTGYRPMILKQSTIMRPIGIFLTYSTELERNAAVMILRDNLPADEFRRLVVWLRITSAGERDR